jgi:hypothetical protein
LKFWLLAAENIREDLQYVVKTDVMLSPGTTPHSIFIVGQGQISLRGPTFQKNTGPRQGKNRVGASETLPEK